MKVENGKIIEATENELYRMYLDRELEDAMDFYEFKYRMVAAGCAIKSNNENSHS